MRGLIGATAFLTRVPVAAGSTPLTGSSLPWFPVVGGVVGALVGGVVAGGVALGVPGVVAAVVAVAVSLITTGALHEDGLADTFDGLGSGLRGAEAIEVMRDPRIGTFGAAALVVSLLLQVTTLAGLAGWEVFRVAVAAHAASRGFAALSLYLPPASGTGLVASSADTITPTSKIAGFAVGMTVAVPLLADRWWILPVALVTGGAVAWWATRRIGGVTGDVVGAVQQVTLVTILVGGSVPI